MENDNTAKIIGGGILAIVVVGIIIALMPFTVVDAGERTVVTRMGVVQRVLDPGMHWVTPLLESTNTYEVRSQKETIESAASSKDLQDVHASIALTFNVNPQYVGEMYRDVGTEYSERIIAPSIQESIKAATARYTAEELITKRAIVTDEIVKNVKEATKVRTSGLDYITITAIAITDFKFSASFNGSIEAKVKAEQDALTEKNKLEKVKYEAQQTIETAKASAEAIRISAQAINSQGGADYVQLQAITKWDGHLPTQMIPGGTVPFLNLKN